MRTKYDPQEAICVLLYKKPLPIEEISQELYNNRNSRVSKYVDNLRKKEWIQVILDTRDGKKKICHPLPKCFIDSIDRDIPLTSHEKEKLKVMFSTVGFKKFVANFTKKEPIPDIEYVKLHIGLYAIYIDILIRYAVMQTGWTIKQCTEIYRDYIKTKKVKEMIFDRYKQLNTMLSGRNDNIILDLDFEDMLLSFINLNSDLRKKICDCYGNSDILYSLAFMNMSVCNSVDSLKNDPEFRNKLNIKK